MKAIQIKSENVESTILHLDGCVESEADCHIFFENLKRQFDMGKRNIVLILHNHARIGDNFIRYLLREILDVQRLGGAFRIVVKSEEIFARLQALNISNFSSIYREEMP